MKQVSFILLAFVIVGSAAFAQSKATTPVTVNPIPAKQVATPRPFTVNPVPPATQKGSNVKQGAAAAHVNKGIPDNDQRLKK